MFEFRLTGPEGNNPLGFLTALGALVTLEDKGEHACLGWDGVTPRLFASLERVTRPPGDEEERREVLVEFLHRALVRKPGESAAKTEHAKREMETAKTAVKKKRDEIKKRKRGRAAAQQVHHNELEPLEEVLRSKTAIFQASLRESAVDPTVALGKNLTELNGKLIDHFKLACEHASLENRRWADIAAAYGIADPSRPDERMMASPWALVSGSGHQDFLSSIEALMIRCTVNQLRQSLFGPWNPKDDKYSLRLDPADDRRHALMDQDPAAHGNKPRTLWGANRLAFEALRFFPAMPLAGGMGVRGWRAKDGDWQHGCPVRWPLWSQPISAAAIQSLLGLRDLWLEEPAARHRLCGLGVHAVMESRRIAVGQGANRKYNLTPATPVWVSTRTVVTSQS